MTPVKKLTVAASLLATLAIPALATVTVNSPANSAEVASPFTLSATAGTCSSQTVASMGYSLDNSPDTTIVYAQSVDASVTSATGAHTLHVKAWGDKGSSCVTDVAITVEAGISAAPTTAAASVIVNSPANSAEVTSPFTLSATAATCSSQAVSAMGYSLDSSSDTTIVDAESVDASVEAAAGAHTLHVKAWGDAGSSCVTDVAITVEASASAAPVIPSDAISVGDLQALSTWKASNDSAAQGSSSGVMSLVNSPSLSGSARKFVTSFLNNGNERYYVSFGDDTTSTNFLYDGWVYIASPSTDLANVEMDMNQVMPNGQTVIFGVQCDGWNGTWDYTANVGTPAAPVDTWLHSKATCNPRNWSVNAWHHVQISYSHNDSGVVTYSAVWLDGAEQALNGTVSSAFALGWAPTLLTNFQIDGVGASGSTTVYLDNLTIYRW